MDTGPMKIGWILMLLFSYQSVCAQIKEKSPVSLIIHDDSLTCDNQSKTVTIHFKLVNNLNENLIFYNIKDEQLAPSEWLLSEYTDTKSKGTGLSFEISDEKQNRKIREISLHDPGSRRHLTKAMFDSLLSAQKLRFLRSALIVKGHSEMEFERMISFAEFKLEKGNYFFQMLYNCAVKSDQFPEMAEISSRENANFLYGSVMSNKVAVVIK